MSAIKMMPKENLKKRKIYENSSDSDEDQWNSPKQCRLASDGDDNDIHSNSYLKNVKLNRRPTRVPDPKTCNRNALMARENRRKKKIYLENLEAEIDGFRKENQMLHKKLKSQAILIKEFQNEQKYFQSLFRNKKEILTVCKALTAAVVDEPMLSSAALYDSVKQSTISSFDFLETPETSPTYSSNSSTTTTYSPGYESSTTVENGRVSNSDPFLSSAIIDKEFYLFSTAFDELPLQNDWEQLFNFNNESSPLSDSDSVEPSALILSEPEKPAAVHVEHNYTNYKNFGIRDDIENDDPSLCLHLSGSKTSLEFCNSCQRSARREHYLTDNDTADELDIIND